jgi:arginine/glutamate-rich protein 1
VLKGLPPEKGRFKAGEAGSSRGRSVSQSPERVDIFGRTISRREQAAALAKKKEEEDARKAEYERQRQIREAEMQDRMLAEEVWLALLGESQPIIAHY